MKQLNQILIARRSVYIFFLLRTFNLHLRLVNYIYWLQFTEYHTYIVFISIKKTLLTEKSKTQLVVHLYGILNDVPVGSKQQ